MVFFSPDPSPMPNQDPYVAQELLSHQTFLRRLAIDLVGDDADDLVQEVWRRALERPPHHGRQLRGWAARVARNLAANRWRGEARRRSREEQRASEPRAGDALEARLELRKELVDALDSLSPSCRETILLRYFEGLAPREIATRQGTPVATVKTRLRRGLGQLREALDKRHGGDRAIWMSAVVPLAAPVGGAGAGTLTIGGMAMGTMMKVSAAVLVAAVCVVFVTRTPPAAIPRMAAVDPPADDAELPEPLGNAVASALDDPATEVARRSPVADELPADASAETATSVLRVILEGIPAADARMVTVTVRGVHDFDDWPAEIAASFPGQGLTSEFDLDPLLARVERYENLRKDELEVAVDHPHLLGGRTRVSLAGGGEQTQGKTVYEARMRLVRPAFWPEFTLAVRDARTLEHLEDVELRIRSGPAASLWGRNQPGTLLGDGLASPIALMGGRDANESKVTVAGMALRPAAGASPRLVGFARRSPPERGVTVSARAPGYAWSSTSLDVSKGERELLLEPAATLHVRLANVQLERYAALDVVPMLAVYWIREDGGNQYVHFERLDQTLESEGLRLDSLVPGGYRVAVELGGGSWTEPPVLALEEIELAAGESGELLLALDESPAPPERASLGGVVSFPDFGGEEEVRLQVYFQPTQSWRNPDFEFALGELTRVGGALPSWSFRVEDLPVGMYRVQLLPFLKVWMIDLTADGAEDLELVLPELAEVLVETVDGRTGERVPRDELWYRERDPVPGQLQRDLTKADTEEPGRFRFWAAPGAVTVWPKFPNGAEREYGGNGKELELVAGFQSVKFEFAPVHAMRFEFRADGTVLPTGPMGLLTSRDIRAVDHEGRVTDGGLQRDMIVEVSAAGLYEIRFDGIDKDRYHPIPPRLVDVRAGETADVIVELRGK